MKIYLLTAMLTAFTFGACFAQNTPIEIKEDFKPSSKNQPGREYPQVNSQGYARFRVEAPEAKSVVVSLGLGGRGGTVLSKNEEGVWMGTTEGPMDEGFHTIISDPPDGKAASKSPHTMRNFMRSKTSPTDMFTRYCFHPLVPIL